jgi:hypothetical protein
MKLTCNTFLGKRDYLQIIYSYTFTVISLLERKEEANGDAQNFGFSAVLLVLQTHTRKNAEQ